MIFIYFVTIYFNGVTDLCIKRNMNRKCCIRTDTPQAFCIRTDTADRIEDK